MRKLFLAVAVVIVSLGLCSCNYEAKLAKSVDGAWTASSSALNIDNVAESFITEVFTFVAEPNSLSGSIIITGIEDLTIAPQNDSIVSDVSQTIAAKSSISGRWNVVDDDEIVLSLDMTTLKVDIDPSDVNLKENALSGVENAVAGRLSAVRARAIASGLRSRLIERYSMMTKLDDVKVKDSMLRFEVGRTDKVLHAAGR